MTLIVACGLRREARIIGRAGADIFAVIGGGNAARLEADLDDMAETFPGIILSAGIAGGLDPALKAGDIVIDGDAAVVAHLRYALPRAIKGRIVGGDTIVASAEDKAALARRSGAVAVDMESHVAAAVARRKGLPFGAVRVICDVAGETLPPAALVGMRPNGGMALGAVLASLARHPAQLPALIRTGRNADRGFAGLKQAFDAIIATRLDQMALTELATD